MYKTFKSIFRAVLPLLWWSLTIAAVASSQRTIASSHSSLIIHHSARSKYYTSPKASNNLLHFTLKKKFSTFRVRQTTLTFPTTSSSISPRKSLKQTFHGTTEGKFINSSMHFKNHSSLKSKLYSPRLHENTVTTKSRVKYPRSFNISASIKNNDKQTFTRFKRSKQRFTSSLYNGSLYNTNFVSFPPFLPGPLHTVNHYSPLLNISSEQRQFTSYSDGESRYTSEHHQQHSRTFLPTVLSLVEDEDSLLQSSVCGEGEWQCGNSSGCIAQQLVCSGVPDCQDQSDEADTLCGRIYSRFL